MGRNARKPRGWISRAILPDKTVNKEFKDNRERFRLFNKMFKEPNKFTFHLVSFASIVLTIIPLCVPGAIYNNVTIAFLVTGAVLSIGGEQAANLHYVKYSELANQRLYESVKWNVRFNQGLRLLGMIGWVLSTFALVMMLFTNNGSLSEIW